MLPTYWGCQMADEATKGHLHISEIFFLCREIHRGKAESDLGERGAASPVLITRNPIWTLDLRVIKTTTSRSLRLPFSVSFHLVQFGLLFEPMCLCVCQSVCLEVGVGVGVGMGLLRLVPRCVCVTCVLMKYWILLPACRGRAVNNFQFLVLFGGPIQKKRRGQLCFTSCHCLKGLITLGRNQYTHLPLRNS